MGFVTPALLAGSALIALPIVLHLIMRRESKLIKFPALRFVQERRTLNQHRLRLRHLLLLALRCAIIAFLAFALARPTLRGSGAARKEGAPLAAALVFDNSLRMQYEENGKTHLTKAKELAGWLINQLPADVPITVADRGGQQRGQDLDHDAADLRITRLELSPVVRPLAEALNDALRWLETKKDYRGEIYVFTDLATEAWPQESLAAFGKSLEQLPGANVYLIDVGATEPKDIGLASLKLSSERVAPGGLLQLNTDVTSTGGAGKDGETPVELFVSDGTSPPEKRGQQVVAVKEGKAAPVEFSLSGLKVGTHQGYVRIVGRDGLPSDDVRYFTVEVRPPSKVLLLAQKPDDAVFLREALSPSTASGLTQSKFACQVATFDKLGTIQLADFAAVCLLDPPPLPSAAWNSLASYADSGGGVGIFLGRHAHREELNEADAQKVLPGKLRWQSREATFVRPVATEHPALHDLGELATTAPWAEFPVFKYWELEGNEPSPSPSLQGRGTGGATTAQVIATFANGRPALIEREHGNGTVVVMTTPVSDSANDDPWNLLPTGPEPWPFIALMNGVVQHLTGNGRSQCNYLAGQTIVLPLGTDEQVSSYVLQLPDGSASRQTMPSNQRNLTIAASDAIGNYRLRAGGQQEKLDRGFSVNAPAEMSRLDRVAAADLVKAIGSERARVARNKEEIEIRVGLGRIGHELFPILILAVALFMAAEQLLANRFYAAPTTKSGTNGNFGFRIADFALKNSSNPQSEIRNPQSEKVPVG